MARHIIFIFAIAMIVSAVLIPGCRPRVYQDFRRPGEICEVHNIRLLDGSAEVYYGYPIGLTKEEIDNRKNLFPNACSATHGGCGVEKGKKKEMLVLVSYCPECRKAEKVWKENHERKMESIYASLEEVRRLLHIDSRYAAVSAGLTHEYNKEVVMVIEGSVKTESDLADLQELEKATNPPTPVRWAVRVSAKGP
ncbi:MAG: hypothetical protein ACJ8FY_13625 [Gemmataceae bacterium]